LGLLSGLIIMGRVILHCDMNNFFATVEEKYNPALRKVPFAVCGDPEMRHNIVLAKNNLAKMAGVITGLSYRQAQEICPGLKFVKANMLRYLKEAKIARQIYRKYTDTIIPYGLDEAWVDLTETGVSMDEGRQIADLIRIEIMYSQDLSASVGVSDNLIFSKFGSDYKKPNATTVITRANYQQLVWPLPSSALLFVGKKREKILANVGIKTIGDIAQANPKRLERLLGKVGYDIWCFANGDDRNFHPENDIIKSIGNTITPPEDLHSTEDTSAIIYLIVEAICKRLRKHNMKAGSVSINLKDNHFNIITRQCTLSYPTDSMNLIFNRAFSLFLRYYPWVKPMRYVGVRVGNLVTQEFEQMVLFETDECEICVDIDERVRNLIARFGKLSFEKTAMTKEW
jgi:DNA polymerase-4